MSKHPAINCDSPMTERIKLSLKRNPKPDTNAADDDEKPATAITRGKKRRVIIEQPKPKAGPQKVSLDKRRKPKKTPSTMRVNALDAELGKYSKVWRSHQPMVLKVEKQVFRFIGDKQLSASKRVVKLLLQKHMTNKNYLVDVVQGASRYNLDGTQSGECTLADEEYSRLQLKRLEVEKIVSKRTK